jgi:DNA-binding IclR family transcriptional regulator
VAETGLIVALLGCESQRLAWATVPDEGAVGFNAIAAPVFDGQASLAAMVGVIAATRNLPDTPPPDLVRALKSASSTISRALGHVGGGSGPELR